MSLASLMSSYDPARQYGNLTAASVTTTNSLTVKGVPITGLLSSGAPESAYSAQTFVEKAHDLSSAYVPTTVLTTNSYTEVASFSDVVEADGTGAWSYSYPVLFKTPPVLTLTPVGGSAGPLLDQSDVSGASGFLRFARSENKFLIAGSGSYTGPGTLGPTAGFNPSANFPTTITGTDPRTWTINLGVLTIPADVDPTKPVTIEMSWAPVQGPYFTTAGQPVATTVFAYLANRASVTDPAYQPITIGAWDNVPAGGTTQNFASQSWNQYQSRTAYVTPGFPYFLQIAYKPIDFSNTTVPAIQGIQTQVDITTIAYYPTGVPSVAAPAPVAPSSMTVTGGRSRFRRL